MLFLFSPAACTTLAPWTRDARHHEGLLQRPLRTTPAREPPVPMVKYSMLRERVARDGICGPGELLTPRAVTDQEILRAHAPDYLKRVASGTLTEREVRRIGFPWSERMVERSRRAS